MNQDVVIESVIMDQPRVVFSGTPVDGGKRHRYVAEGRSAMPRAPLAGEVWRVAGRPVRHPVHGLQVAVDEAKLIRPSGRIIVHVLASARFEGVGEATARRLWEHHGEALYHILEEGDEQAITTVTGGDPKGRRQAEAIVRGWKGLLLEMNVVAWLERHAVEPALAVKVVGCYGDDAAQAIEEDPFRLLVFGAGWNEVDGIAQGLGLGVDDPRRLCAAVEHCARLRFSTRGDTWLVAEELEVHLGRLVEARRVGTAIACASDLHAIAAVKGGWQAAGPAALEEYVAREIVRRSPALPTTFAGETAAGGSGVPQADQEYRSHALDDWEVSAAMRLTPRQREAVRVALTADVAVVTGGAGTGKTAVLAAIAALAERAGETVLPIALSGRAALRITEATGRQARTIAGFLQIHERGREVLPIRALVIVDEASMVDLTLLYRILAVLDDRGRLLLVGDPAQLPPIGPGLTLHALVCDPSIPRIHLTDIVRQAAETGIPAAGNAIREGAVPEAITGTAFAPGLAFVECAPSDVAETAIAIAAAEGGRVQMIAATKGTDDTGSGTRRLNALCHDRRTAPGPLLHGRFHVGEPVIWTENDHDIGLMNGELGVVRGPSGGAREGLDVDFAGRRVDLPPSKLRHLELAYAITVHKAQGSAFDSVVMPIVANPLLDRTLIYTGLTRAKRRIVFVGDRKAFVSAVVAEPSSSRRRSALGLHLETARRDPDLQVGRARNDA